jgi:hypothetical protein
MLWLFSCILQQKQEEAMAKKYFVTLTDEERAQLLALTKRGKVSARRLTRAHLLLQADAGVSDEAIAQALHIGMATVERIRKRFVEEGLKAALTEHPRPGDHGSWMGSKKPSSSRWPAARHPRDGRVGRCNYWRISLWNSKWSRPSPMRQCAAHSKKRPQAMAEGGVVSSQCER